jgi:hypothetical protein
MQNHGCGTKNKQARPVLPRIPVDLFEVPIVAANSSWACGDRPVESDENVVYLGVLSGEAMARLLARTLVNFLVGAVVSWVLCVTISTVVATDDQYLDAGRSFAALSPLVAFFGGMVSGVVGLVKHCLGIFQGFECHVETHCESRQARVA